jgi:NTE family protein
MLFHLGALWRLNELGYLRKLDRVSSVSGGSITAGVLGLAWPSFSFDPCGVATNFVDEVVTPLRGFAGKTIDYPAIVLGVLLPGQTVSGRIARSYRQQLFGTRTLQDLPDEPRFVINATSLQSGVLFRFSKPYLWDYRVGEVKSPSVQLATAVAASSAFPPFLSPARIEFSEDAFTPGTGDDLETQEYTRESVLTDGGVYDNLGLETAWKRYTTILVSDGGGQMSAEPRPHADWPLQTLRVLDVTDNQVRSLRKRQVIDGFTSQARLGTYWGIRSQVAAYHLPDSLPCPPDKTLELASIATRLGSLPDPLRDRLINWGYAITDTAMRKHVTPQAPVGVFPYPGGVG